MAVKLPMTEEEFDEDQKTKFKQSIASAAAVSVNAVTIDDVTSMRRSGGGIRVDTSIVAADEKAAASMVDTLSNPDTINEHLSKNGLPPAEIVDSPTLEITSGTSSPTEKESNKTPIIVGSVVAAVVVVLIAAGAYFFIRKRRTKDADAHVWTDAARETSSQSQGAASTTQQPESPGPNTMSPGPNLMSTPRIPQVARSMRAQQETDNRIIGDFSVLREQTHIDEVVMNVDGVTDGTETVSRVPVQATVIDFTKPPEEFKSDIAKQIQAVLSKSNVNLTADSGFFHARPMEAGATEVLASSTQGQSAGAAVLVAAGENTSSLVSGPSALQAAASAAPKASYASPLSRENNSAYDNLRSPAAEDAPAGMGEYQQAADAPRPLASEASAASAAPKAAASAAPQASYASPLFRENNSAYDNLRSPAAEDAPAGLGEYQQAADAPRPLASGASLGPGASSTHASARDRLRSMFPPAKDDSEDDE